MQSFPRTWFNNAKNYLYIPLGGSRGSKLFTARNIMLTFLICGFWHGADWKFVIWGGLNGLFLLPIFLTDRHRRYRKIVAHDRALPTPREFINMVITFLLTAFSIIFLRADSAAHAVQILTLLFQDPVSWFSLAIYLKYKYLLLTLVLFFSVEWRGRREQYGLEKFGLRWPRPLRWAFYIVLLTFVVYFLFSRPGFEFVYFHF